jgi:hypothetical protein
MAEQGELSLTLLVSSGWVGGIVALSYALVLFDVAGFFPLALPPASGYLQSHYWLGLPADTVVSIVFLQLLAASGAIVWFVWLATTPDKDLQNSILHSETNRIFIIQLFLWSSTLWPFAAHFYLTDRNTIRAILACIPLWSAAVAVVLMIGGSFEAGSPPIPTLGVLFLGLVVVLCDGTGWAAVCIKSTLR